MTRSAATARQVWKGSWLHAEPGIRLSRPALASSPPLMLTLSPKRHQAPYHSALGQLPAPSAAAFLHSGEILLLAERNGGRAARRGSRRGCGAHRGGRDLLR